MQKREPSLTTVQKRGSLLEMKGGEETCHVQLSPKDRKKKKQLYVDLLLLQNPFLKLAGIKFVPLYINYWRK